MSLIAALGGSAVWVFSYINQFLGGYEITIWPMEYGSGKISAAILPGCLSLGRQLPYAGALPNQDWRIGIQRVFQFSYRITDGGFWVSSGRTNLFRAWDVNIHLGAVLAMASVYPMVVSRRFRRIVKWACFLATVASFWNVLSLLARVAQDPDEPWRLQFFEEFIELFLLAMLGAYLFFRDHKESRKRPGNCRTCGYSLSGNVSGVCPECGKTIEREKLTGRGTR